MGVAMVWALILSLLYAGFMIFGQSKHPKSLDVFAWLTFWFFAVGIGLSYMYFFFYMQIIQAFGDNVTINLTLQTFAILGGMFVLCIIHTIFWRLAFKDRVAMGRNKKGEEVEIED